MNTVDDELKKLLADRFEGWEIADFLNLSAEDVVEAFWDKIQECREDVEDYVGLRSRND